MLHFNGYDVTLLLLLCDLIKQEMLCVAAGALDRTSLKGIGQVRVAQGLQIAAAAASLAEVYVEGDVLLPHSASAMSSTRYTETPARYISVRASSTLLSRLCHCSIMAVSKEIPLSLGTLRVMSTEVVVRFSPDTAHRARTGPPGSVSPFRPPAAH